jgi:phosphatidylethanolamine-binding protein
MVKFTVQYGQANANGKTLSRRNTASQPDVTFTGEEGKSYTLLMSDPDAPAKSWLHWLITNIPGEAVNVEEGQVLVKYSGPSPPSGIHRYMFTLYEQPGGSIMVTAPLERGNFQVGEFEQHYGLSKLVSRTVKVPSK